MAFQPPGASGASIWRRVAAPFQVDHRTVAINPAGHGETALLSASVSMTVRDEAQALAAVIHTERPDNPGVHVIGHSCGGTIFNHLLANPGSEGVVAVIVYPMNALINSQTNELST